MGLKKASEAEKQDAVQINCTGALRVGGGLMEEKGIEQSVPSGCSAAALSRKQRRGSEQQALLVRFEYMLY